MPDHQDIGYLYPHNDTGRIWSHCDIMYLWRSLLYINHQPGPSRIGTRSRRIGLILPSLSTETTTHCRALTSSLHLRRARRATGIVQWRLGGGGHRKQDLSRQDGSAQ